MRLPSLLLILFLLATRGLAQRSRLPDLTKDYHLIFADNFNYPSVDSLLSPKLRLWAPEHTWGNAHWDPATKCDNIHPGNFAYRPEDIRMAGTPADTNRVLALDFNYHSEPLRRVVSSNGTVGEGLFYKTSGLVRSTYRDLSDTTCKADGFKYGIFEFRCKVPATDGLQAAIWLWSRYRQCGPQPDNWTDKDSWEIDLFETYKMPDRRVFFGTLQPNALRNHQPTSTHYSFPEGKGPDDQFHVYTLVWTPNLIAWYVDGRLFKRLRNPRNSTNNPAGIPDTRLNLLLSSHYQWDCKKNYHCDLLQDSVTVNDQQCPTPNDPFLIDYVRVYYPNTVPAASDAWPQVEKRRRKAKAPQAAVAAQ